MPKKILSLITVLLMVTCKQVYTPPVISPSSGYLVVEGFINSTSKGVSSIQLTRTTKLLDTIANNTVYETNAQVTIEGDGNDAYVLNETPNGTYVSDSITLSTTEKYHIRIKTADGMEYLSDYSTIRSTPDIDSISWQRDNEGVGIYVNTHDALNQTKYYQWRYTETWEFHSPNYSSIVYVIDPTTNKYLGVRYRNADQSVDTTIFKCWQTVNSSAITLGTTEKLVKDRIFQRLIYIEPGSDELSVRYSVLVKQYAISHEAYLFFETLKKNTEQLGSLFDVQPSELQGNIHCTTNPNEPVIGFVEVSQEKQQRIFISNDQLPDWPPKVPCSTIAIDNNPDSIAKYGVGLFPTSPQKVSLGIISFFATYDINCIDCTQRGTNVRPNFWP